MNIGEFYKTLAFHIPFDSGFMMQNGLSVYETPFDQVGFYDLAIVPYIWYNEEGTKFTQKNKGFISIDTIGTLNRYNTTGEMPINRDKQFLERQNNMLVTLGAVDHVTGTDL